MITDPILPQDIRYNPASACFEAKVTVHGAGPARVYACEIEGDLSLEHPEIAAALLAEAQRRCHDRAALCSQIGRSELQPKHRPETATRRGWLSRLPYAAGLSAA